MKKEKINGLDLIRLYGIGLILLYHIFRGFLPGGFIGVNIMFVLSGFLVTFHLLGEIYEKGSIELSSYYKKRFLRIFPGLFFMILTVSILAIFINKDYTVDFFDQFLASFSFTTNYYEILSGGSYEAQFVDHLFVHTWFLAIEVHFYIIWPLLISFLYRLMSKAKNRIKTFSKYFLLINLALFGLTSLLTIGITLVGGHRSFVYFSDFTRFSSFFMGAMLACFVRRFSFRQIHYKKFTYGLGIIIFLMALILSYDKDLTYILAFPLVDIMAGLGILTAYSNRARDENPLISKAARFTYPIYLIHWPIYVIASSFLKTLPAILLTILASSLWVIVDYYIYEPIFLGKELMIPGTGKAFDPKAPTRIRTVIGSFLLAFGVAGGVSYASDDMVSLEKDIWLKSIEQDLRTIARDKKSLDDFVARSEEEMAAATTITGIGDSTLLGPSQYLEENISNLYIDAKKSRPIDEGAELIRSMENEGSLGDIVLLALGTNAEGDPDTSLRNIVEALPDGKRLILVTCYDGRYDSPHPVSVAMEKIAKEYDFISLMDWEKEALAHPEYYEGGDQVHFYGNMDAYESYKNMLDDAIKEALQKNSK